MDINVYLKFLTVYAMLIQNKKPVIGPHDVNFWDYKDGDVYMKGALMLHTLRNTIDNDSLFFDIIKSFYNKYKFNIAVTQNFIDLVNSKTDKDLSCFFQHYLYKRECPQLLWEFYYNSDKKTNELCYKWSNISDEFSIPIKIKTDSDTIVINPTMKLQRLELSNDNNISINIEGSYIALKRTRKIVK